MWKVVHSHLGSKSQNPIASLLSSFTSIGDAVEAINGAFGDVFTPQADNGDRAAILATSTNGKSESHLKSFLIIWTRFQNTKPFQLFCIQTNYICKS